MIGAGLLAKKAVERGLDAQAVGEVEPRSRLEGRDRVLREGGPHALPRGARLPHRRLRLHDLHRQLGPAAGADLAARSTEGDLVVCAVLSGNRNFEARIHAEVKANYLASPPLVVAYALAGRMDVDLATEPIGVGSDGEDVFLADIWPTPEEVRATVAGSIGEEMFRADLRRRLHRRRDVARRSRSRRASSSPGTEASTYVRRPPYFDGMPHRARRRSATSTGARCLVWVGDSVTTDHISPAGSIKPELPAGRYLLEHGVERKRVQLLRLAAREPRGDGARHVRERPPPQPARAGVGGRRGPSTCPRATRRRSSRPPSATARRACR